MDRTCIVTKKEKTSSNERLHTNMSVEDRILFLADLIAQKIKDDQTSGNNLLRKINGLGDGTTNATN